jgi:hypothetical protein
VSGHVLCRNEGEHCLPSEAGEQDFYDDGRPGHRNVQGSVLEVENRHGMLVKFDDRADTTYVTFSDRRWMDFITVVP